MKMPNMIAIWVVFDFGYKYMTKKNMALGLQWYADDTETQAWHLENNTWIQNKELIGDLQDEKKARRSLLEEIKTIFPI